MAASRMKILKVIVVDKPNSIDTAYYIDKNIYLINQMGYEIRMEKIEEDELDVEMVESLKKRGITHFPAMIGASLQNPIIGKDAVIDMFDKGLRGFNRAGRLSTGGTGGEIGTNSDLSSFWYDELYNGRDNKGNPVARKDKDEKEDEGADIERRMREYERNVPQHRRRGAARDTEFDETTLNQRRQQRHRQRDPEPDDNIAYEDMCNNCGRDPCVCTETSPGRANEPRGGNITGLGGDAMDDKMLDAWMQNNPSGDY